MQNVLEKQKRCMKIVNIKINGKKTAHIWILYDENANQNGKT